MSGQERLAESKERCRENEVEEGGEIGGGEPKSHSSRRRRCEIRIHS